MHGVVGAHLLEAGPGEITPPLEARGRGRQERIEFRTNLGSTSWMQEA